MSNLLDDYIESHASEEPEYLRRLERLSNLRMVHGRMCSGRVQGRLLKLLVQMLRPRRVLELGTFTGYSALCIAEGLEPGGLLTTIEANDELEDFLREQFAASPFADRIDLRIGEALKLMADMQTESLDLIFIDADKRAYPEFYEEAMRLLRPGGFILADNVLWDGHVSEADRHDPQTLGVRRFNDLVAVDPRTEQVIIPLRDGLSLIRKK